MLRLRSCIVSHILSSLLASPVSTPHRILSAAAPPISAAPAFAVEDYLVDTCGLTRSQATKASTKISHLKSPANPEAVLAFLAGLGLSSAAVAAAVARDPHLLCARLERTLLPNVAGITRLGLSGSDAARLVTIAGEFFRVKALVPKLRYYLPLLGSSENLLRALKKSSHLLTVNLDRVVKPNVAFLQECGLGACDIAKLCMAVPRILTANPEHVRAMVACAEGVGVPRGSGMFRNALQAVSFISEEKIATKVEYLKKTFRWSDAEVSHAVCKAPMVLRKAKGSLQQTSEFFLSEMGLEPAYIAPRPALLSYSIEGRLKPRTIFTQVGVMPVLHTRFDRWSYQIHASTHHLPDSSPDVHKKWIEGGTYKLCVEDVRDEIHGETSGSSQDCTCISPFLQARRDYHQHAYRHPQLLSPRQQRTSSRKRRSKWKRLEPRSWKATSYDASCSPPLVQSTCASCLRYCSVPSCIRFVV